jgi:D-xylose transport system ATP-binding protein
MSRGVLVGSHRIGEVTKDDVLSLIIKGALPDGWTPRDGSG